MDDNDARWVVAEKNGCAENMANHMKTSPLIGQMILNRGIHNIPQAWDFLHPSLRLLHDSALIPNISLAAQRIVRAFRSGDPIAVFGDYDVDGVTATATLYHTLKFLGADVRVYVPHRIDEGYGLNPAAMNKLIDEGARLLVSVDCGITGLEAADACMLRGVDLIITDHHEWKAELPAAYCIVHPRLPMPGRPAYPNPDLCGAGVAFKLAWEIGRAFYGSEKVAPEFSELLQELLAFTALGTIADVVPLIGENRAIAHFGLNKLPTSRFPGLDAFIESAHLKGQEVDGYHVGFCLAPRLNAAGRLGHASEALNMLTTYDREAALAIGQELEKQNKRRQETERAIAQEAIAAAEALRRRSPRSSPGRNGTPAWWASWPADWSNVSSGPPWCSCRARTRCTAAGVASRGLTWRRL
jgi:single-stranded-DNA-specific exonuclease